MKGEQYSDTATDDAETFLHLYPMFCVVVFNFNFYFLCFPLYVIHSMLTLQSYNDLFNNNTTTWEAPWSSGEGQGLTIQAMVLGREFESWLHLKTRWKDGPLDGRKIPKIIMTAKWGKSHRNFFFCKFLSR